jgi:hypothetical protein
VAGCFSAPCTNVAQTIWEPEVYAWCSHQPIWEENPNRRHLHIKFKEAEAVIISVTTYFKDGSVDNICINAKNNIHLEGMFPEGLHGKILKVKILVAYKGRVFEIPVFCNIKAPI